MSGHIVFVRFFPGYSGAFPYDRIAHLKDKEINAALESLSQRWWNEPANRESIKTFRAKVEEGRNALELRVLEWEQAHLARPGMNRCAPEETTPEVDTPQPERKGSPDFEEIACAAGWRDGQCYEEFPPYSISPRYAVARVEDEDSATAVAEALNERVAELAKGTYAKSHFGKDKLDWLFATANPRFLSVAEHTLSSAEALRAGEQIQRIRAHDIATSAVEEAILRDYWSMLLPTLEQLSASPTSGLTSIPLHVDVGRGPPVV
jgi:hypothetical protein